MSSNNIRSIFLLGPGFPKENLEHRIEVKNTLESSPYNNYLIHIMELIIDIKPEPPFDYADKFLKIIFDKNPKAIFVIFPNEYYLDSVYYELGLLRSHLGPDEFRKKVKFLVQDEIHWDTISFYIKKLIPAIGGIIPFETWTQIPEAIRDCYQSFYES